MTTPAKRIGLWCPHGYKEPGDCLTCSERYSLHPAMQPVTPTPWDAEFQTLINSKRLSNIQSTRMGTIALWVEGYRQACANMGLPPGAGPERVRALVTACERLINATRVHDYETSTAVDQARAALAPWKEGA